MSRTAPSPAIQEWAARLRQAMKSLGRGAQQQAAFDLRIAPITVSRALRGLDSRVEVLAIIEEWLRARGALTDGSPDNDS